MTIPEALEKVKDEAPPSRRDLCGSIQDSGLGGIDPVCEHPWLIRMEESEAATLQTTIIGELLEILWADLEFWLLLYYGPTTVVLGDITELDSLATRLKEPAPDDLVSHFLTAKLSRETRNRLLAYKNVYDCKMAEALANDFNEIIKGANVHNAKRFAGILLSPPTEDLRSKHPGNLELICLNRRLLVDAYPANLQSGIALHRITWWLQSRIGLSMPEFPAETWKAFGRDSDARKKLFELISGQHWRLNPPSHLIGSPEEKNLQSTITAYFRYDNFDMQKLLAHRFPSPDQRKLIIKLATRLKSDAEEVIAKLATHVWVDAEGNKNEFVDTLPLEMRKDAQRPKDIHVARRRESMVELYRAHPDETQWWIADQRPDVTVGVRTRRREAKSAADLLKLREGITVERHVDEMGVGRRPNARPRRGQ